MRHLFVLLLFAAACGDVSKPVEVVDAMHTLPDVDGEIIDPPDPDAAVPKRGGIASTSGGGVTASTQHRLRLRIGAPQPMGTASSTNHRVVTGPGALP